MNRLALILGFVGVIGFAAPAFAIDLSKPILDLKGDPIKDETGKVANATVGGLAEVALLNSYADEQNLSGDEKAKRFRLAIKIHDAGNIDLSADDITLIKRLVVKAFPTLVVGRIFEVIDPQSLK